MNYVCFPKRVDSGFRRNDVKCQQNLVKPGMRGEGKGLRARDADRIGWCVVRLPRPEDVDRRKLPRRARAAGQMAAGDTDGPTWCNSVRQLSGLMDG